MNLPIFNEVSPARPVRVGRRNPACGPNLGGVAKPVVPGAGPSDRNVLLISILPFLSLTLLFPFGNLLCPICSSPLDPDHLLLK